MQSQDVKVGTTQVANEARLAADEAEELRTMPPGLVDTTRAAGLFRMAMPRALGGFELDPMSIVGVIEEVSASDASAGWTVLNGNSSAFFAWLEPTEAKEMLDGVVDIIATSMFAPLGRARRDGEDLIIDGRWPFNSGCVHADWYQAGIMVMDDDGPAHRPDGSIDTRFATFPRHAADIIDTWHSMGLRGTGSHDIEVRELRIPAEHSAAPMIDPPTQKGGLWELGFFPLLAVLMSGFPLGVARHALDEFTALAPTKRRGASHIALAEDSRVQYDLGRAEAAVQSARSFVYDVIGDSWTTITAGSTPTPEQLGRVTVASQQAMQAALNAVDVAFGFAGAAVVYSGHPLERCFRDLHTANQHIGFSGDGFSSYARARLAG